MTLTPFMATIENHVLPETVPGHVADQGSPGTVPVVVTMAPVGIVTSVVADITGVARSRTEQLAA
jgi:hypothetical protein